jgi:DNA-directed RNA polymerase specialized sigma24 family protein
MRDQQGFADFAAAQSGPLRRQAYLLTGSVSRADRIVERALADTGRRWSRLGSASAAAAHARGLVAAGAVRSRGAVPAVALTSLGTALPTDDAGEAVWRALAGLPPRRRAVLVLRYDEGLSDAAVAERLGVPAATVAAEGEAGLAALRSLLRRRGAPEDLLPTTLAARAAELPAPPPHPAPGAPSSPASGGAGGGRAAAVADSGGSGRGPRRRWLLVGGGVVAVAAVVAALVVPGLRDDPVGAAGAVVPARQATAPGELPWAGRGPLVGDRDLLRDALRTWQDGVPDRQRPTAASVLYAGAPDGARTVLLQGTDGSGQSWVAEVTDAGGTPALRTTEPLGRTVPLLALAVGDRTRLLAPPDPSTTLLALQDGTLRRLTLDGDGLSEPVTPPPTGLPVAVGVGPVAVGSGSIRPGRLSAVTGTVELARGTLDLDPDAVTATWYDDGALLARRLGGAITVAGLGPTRTTTITVGGRSRQVDARAYEAVRGGTRYLATVVRVDGRAACVATSATGPVDAGPAGPAVLVSRCRPAKAAEGVVQAVAAGGVRSVRVRLTTAAKGKPARVVEVTGSSGTGLVGLAKVGGLPTGPAPGVARDGDGAIVARFTVPAYQGG